MSIASLLPHDKALHLLGGVAIFAAARPLAVWTGAAASAASLVGIGIAATVAIAKEVYDLKHRDKHTPDAADALCTLAGGLLGAACTLPLP